VKKAIGQRRTKDPGYIISPAEERTFAKFFRYNRTYHKKSQNSVSRRWVNILLESSNDTHKVYALLNMLGPDLIKEGTYTI
jgi:hypothetical protein